MLDNNLEQDFTRDSNEDRSMGQNNPAGSSNENPKKNRRGFAAMSPERQRQIASEGGRAAHRLGVAHQWNSNEAREAGRKGGQNSKGGGRRSERNTNNDDII
jgi:uncharacterized protein